MKTKTEIYVNRMGLEFSVEMMFVEKDDKGDLHNDWFIDSYSLAKIALYIDAIELLPFEKEQMEISKILSIGVENYLNSKL